MLQKVQEQKIKRRHLEPLVHIRVECTASNGQSVTDYHIPEGVHELQVPQSVLEDEIKPLIETESLEAARSRYELEVEKWMRESGVSDDSRAPWSVAKAFKVIHAREVRPLRNLEILGTSDPELTPEQRSIAAVAQAVTKGQASNRKSKRAE